MMNQNGKNFAWLNREGRWKGHHWDGLEIAADGSLRLRALPLASVPEAQTPSGLPAPDGPAGIAMDALGTLYFSDPAMNHVWSIDGCDGNQRYLGCLDGLRTPRGLLWSESRQALLIVDSGNHRIQIFNPALSQVVGIWGGQGSQPGEFETPWTLAADQAGAFYVTDYGNQRVQKFNAVGDLVPAFWQNLAAAKILSQPADVAAGEDGGVIRIYILDEAAQAVFVVDSDGHPVLDGHGNPVSFGKGILQQGLGLAVIGANIFVGDNGTGQVLEFSAPDGHFDGAAVGYQGNITALAAGSKGELLVLSDGGAPPVTLALGQGYARQGVFWSAAIEAPGGKVSWHRLEAIRGALAPDAHLELFFYTSNSIGDAPAPPQLAAAGSNPFTDPKWRTAPADATDVFIGGRYKQCVLQDADPATYLWCGAWFSGDGLATPSVSQLRVEFDHETYLAGLPAIYRKPGICADFLKRFLSLLETFNQRAEAAIHNLPALFDPRAAPPEYLPWLADWLAAALEEDWDTATIRRAIEEAFASYGRRGTAAGLRAALKEYAGVDAIVEEPLLHAALWALPAPAASPCGAAPPDAPVTWQDGENSILGYTTMLAPAAAQGAVAGATAVLDQSHLITDADFGVPLFEDVAFQFSVLVYRGQVNCPATLALVESVIEQEKPAHTAYQLCILEPRMTVGFQARVGIDTIVAGPPTAMRLGDTPGLGIESVLGGQPPGRIGAQSQLGLTTLLG